ncbi:unnamed protein product [Rotaria sordida]|uniref:Uncharacterized protein n=1 Tax=Rotaria sordida TaxID=392033 RepID=A0A813VU37_9BILA|nr:unnamed protein product [Rotaria sordida]
MMLWKIVVGVYYLPLMKIAETELSINFARRVKTTIVKQGDFIIINIIPYDQSLKPPRYSSTYEDDTYQYRHVILDKNMLALIPKTRLMDEYE